MREPVYSGLKICHGPHRWDLRWTPFHREMVCIDRSIRHGIYIFGVLVHHTTMHDPVYSSVRIGYGLHRWDLRWTPFHREVIRIGRSIRNGVYVFGVLVHHSARQRARPNDDPQGNGKW